MQRQKNLKTMIKPRYKKHTEKYKNQPMEFYIKRRGFPLRFKEIPLIMRNVEHLPTADDSGQ